LRSIAEIYKEKNFFDKAIAFYEESLESTKVVLGEYNSEVALIFARIGNIHFEQGNLDAALQAYSSGLRVERHLLHPDHPNIIMALTIIGEIYMQKSGWDDAARIYNEVLELQHSTFGVEHEDISSTLDAHGYWRQQNLERMRQAITTDDLMDTCVSNSALPTPVNKDYFSSSLPIELVSSAPEIFIEGTKVIAKT